jgi:hypothetical protein
LVLVEWVEETLDNPIREDFNFRIKENSP